MNHKKAKLLSQIHSLIYPKYPSGCSPQIFIESHQNLYEALSKFDSDSHSVSNQHSSSKEEYIKADEQCFNQKLVIEIINRLTQSCTFCHRKQFSQKLQKMIVQFKGNLKHLKISAKPIKISLWQNILDMEDLNGLMYEVKQKQILIIYDNLYQFYNRIPHQQTLLLQSGQIMKAKDKFSNIIHSSQSHIPMDHQYYLALIAAATYGCKYLWNRSVGNFLRVGGDLTWITQGILAAPQHLQDLSRFSCLMAYNFGDLFESNIFDNNRRSGSGGVDNQYKLESFLILSYYQSLSCLDLIFGIIPQSSHFEEYLPNIPYLKPCLQTFESIHESGQMSNLYELQKANQFTNMYSFEDNYEEYRQKIKKITSRSFTRNNKACNGNLQKTKKIQSLEGMLEQDSIYLLGKVQKDQIEQKIKHLEEIHYITTVFQKYVNFSPISTCFAKNQNQPTEKSIEDQFILASEWDFDIKGLNKIQSSLGAKYRQNLQNFITSLRRLDSQKSKKLKSYYQFFNNYMYEYMSYSKLVKQLTMVEKNYLKLITKSPFLFNEQTFARMKEDLSKLGINVIDFVFEAISYKLQLNINLITYIFKKQSEQDYYQYE